MLVRACTPQRGAEFIQWMASKTGTAAADLVGPYRYEALGALRKGDLIGVFLLTQFRSGDAEVICAGDRGWLTRGAIKGIFAFAFCDLRLRRLTAIVHHQHSTSRKLVEGLGFKLEGVKLCGMDDGEDAMHYGLLAKHCRWI